MRRCRTPRTQARYGLRGTRVGEASHPGPPDIEPTALDSQADDSDGDSGAFAGYRRENSILELGAATPLAAAPAPAAPCMTAPGAPAESPRTDEEQAPDSEAEVLHIETPRAAAAESASERGASAADTAPMEVSEAAPRGDETGPAVELLGDEPGPGAGDQSASDAEDRAPADAANVRHRWPNRCLRTLDGINLASELRHGVRTVREPPRWFREPLRGAYKMVLEEWAAARSDAPWKLFALLPRMLLRPTSPHGANGKAEFLERLRRFRAGDWASLLEEARAGAQGAKARRGRLVLSRLPRRRST